MKKLLTALLFVFLLSGFAYAEEGGRLFVLIGLDTVPYSKAQFYNPEGNTAPIKVTLTITETGADFIWELLPQPVDGQTSAELTIEPTTGE